MAMWEQRSIQPAAAAYFGSSVSNIPHIGSYNCRAVRSSDGRSTRMSTHGTADTVDIAGFDLADGTCIRLRADWVDAGPKADFLRVVWDGTCDWFDLTLSPDYNMLHEITFTYSRADRGCVAKRVSPGLRTARSQLKSEKSLPDGLFSLRFVACHFNVRTTRRVMSCHEQ
ncbi:MAG: hypothetical protein ACJAVT_000217 [Yoonia sp.]|jgi:hypothetical protein